MIVDAAYAPELLIYRLDHWPSFEEQHSWRAALVADGKLKAHTCVLIDVRHLTALPTPENVARVVFNDIDGDRRGRIAYVVSTKAQQELLEEARVLCTGAPEFGVFLTERQALFWLFLSFLQ